MPELDQTKRRVTWTIGRAASRRVPLAISHSQYGFSEKIHFFQENSE